MRSSKNPSSTADAAGFAGARAASALGVVALTSMRAAAAGAGGAGAGLISVFAGVVAIGFDTAGDVTATGEGTTDIAGFDGALLAGTKPRA